MQPANPKSNSHLTRSFNRLPQLDFLRGIAILLVLLRHQQVWEYTTNMGWIGVDLFFVLSGFLVSGLLFKEFQSTGTVCPGRFLLRRGFKIYPLYFLFYPLYLVPFIQQDILNWKGVLSEISFTQNYIWGWGYAFGAGWSLAIEEHFYFGFALLWWWGLRSGKFTRPDSLAAKPALRSPVALLLTVLVLCLLMRFASNLLFPAQVARHFTMTHLRIDSLLAGVLVAYLYYFRQPQLRQFYEKSRSYLWIPALAAIAWTPFINPEPSFFVRTIGFTLLYSSFATVLFYFIISPDITTNLKKIVTSPLFRFVAFTGRCSYAIYIIHPFVNYAYGSFIVSRGIHTSLLLNLAISSCISIGAGALLTITIEKYFLGLRERLVPADLRMLVH